MSFFCEQSPKRLFLNICFWMCCIMFSEGILLGHILKWLCNLVGRYCRHFTYIYFYSTFLLIINQRTPSSSRPSQKFPTWVNILCPWGRWNISSGECPPSALIGVLLVNRSDSDKTVKRNQFIDHEATLGPDLVRHRVP